VRGRLAVLKVRQPMSIVIALAIASFVLALVVADQLFPLLSANNDEAVYLFQARIFRSGHLTLPADDYRDFFRPWMSSEHDEQLILVFQPVFPALLALSDLVFGSMRVVLGLIAGGSVLLVYALARELELSTRARVIACAFFALSPFAVIQSALYLEYLFAVALEMAVLTLLLAGLRSAAGRRARRLTAAGLLFGLLVFTRPLEGLMLGVAMGLYLIVRERTLARALRQLGWPVLGAIPPVLPNF
jgi:4-amino-4-deoxy-L-arabinose transferase-like glycosyltransferase